MGFKFFFPRYPQQKIKKLLTTITALIVMCCISVLDLTGKSVGLDVVALDADGSKVGAGVGDADKALMV